MIRWWLILMAGSLCAQPPAASVCATCHPNEHAEWSVARHGRMLQPAGTASVRGDFGVKATQLRGLTFGLRQADGNYFITESFLTGRPAEHRVDYTLGSRRIQHYLSRLADGRIVVLPPTWDVERRQWFHNLDIVNPEESDPGVIQVWNRNCYSCHVSQEKKNFDSATGRYATEWTDFGTNCVRCHGNSASHVARRAPDDVVRLSRLSAQRSTMVCAQCHSLREISAEGFSAGADYNDYFLSVLEYNERSSMADPSYWADGRTRRFSSDSIGFWQSQCFLKGGATCLNCHSNVHDPEVQKAPQLRAGANATCTGCHKEIGGNVSGHTRHRADSTGSACIECHMPRTVLSIKAKIRDHSMSIPAPENTIRHNIPNACGECHRDRPATWAREKVQQWFGAGKRQNYVRRADAFAGARANDRAAVPALLAILTDPAEGFLMRANAAGHLSRFGSDPRATPAMIRALSDPEPRVRAAAALGLQSPEAADALRRALSDTSRSVRISAARALANLGPLFVPRNDAAFARASAEVAAHFAVSPDDAAEQFAAGRYFLQTGQPKRALEALALAARLDPRLPVRYFVAASTVADGRMAEGRTLLEQVPAGDPHYADARQFLRSLSGIQ